MVEGRVRPTGLEGKRTARMESSTQVTLYNRQEEVESGDQFRRNYSLWLLHSSNPRKRHYCYSNEDRIYIPPQKEHDLSTSHDYCPIQF